VGLVAPPPWPDVVSTMEKTPPYPELL
jgi:hypothetical protein